MQVQISGKHVDVGDALRSRIEGELSQGIEKYFERGGAADVVVTKEGRDFRIDAVVNLASGQQIVGHSLGADAHGAFDGLLDKLEKRVRRYKRRLKDRTPTNGADGLGPEATEMAFERVPITVLRSPEAVEDDEFGQAGSPSERPPEAMVIAETERQIRSMTVGMAVLELDLTGYPVVLFKNAAHGGLSVVYRRPDGNVGWIDPERTRSVNGHGSGL
jgi:ribosomal subunit interface protein